MDLSSLTALVDAGKLGGWVRATVGSGLATLLIKFPVLAPGFDPATQAAVATLAASVVVGFWSHISKGDSK